LTKVFGIIAIFLSSAAFDETGIIILARWTAARSAVVKGQTYFMGY
jgi:hypothetical protein